MAKVYLGDGAYVDFDGYALVLTAENGIEVTNRIVLEPEVYGSLLNYVRALQETHVQRDIRKESAQQCGCDPGAARICEAHRA